MISNGKKKIKKKAGYNTSEATLETDNLCR